MAIKYLKPLLFIVAITFFNSCAVDDSKEKESETSYTNDDFTTLDKSGIGAVAANGQLQVIGTKLCNEKGEPVQLRGMSTHGLQWHGSDITEEAMDILAYNWKCDIVRISLYAREGGYETNPEKYTKMAKEKIDMVIARGMYAVIDWHQLTPGNPNEDKANAITYLTEMATTYKDSPNVIYEICNEPNNCEWSDVKSYAEEVIPIVRAIDSDAVIIVGTHAWGSLGLSDGENEQVIIKNPVNATNIIYSFHFYAAEHSFDYYGAAVKRFSKELPVIVSEFGTQNAAGEETNDFNETDKYLQMFKDESISWINWNFSDDPRSGAVLQREGDFSNLKEAGYYIRNNIINPANSWD